MDLGSLFLLLALLIFVAGFVLRPLQERGLDVVSQEEHEYVALLAERDRLLDALAELDFDKELGKVPGDLYPLQRENLLKRGADVLRKLDGLQASGAVGLAEEIEGRVARRRAKLASAVDDPLEAMIAARKEAHQSRGGTKFCSNCGARTAPGDKFCVSCGERLT